MSMLKKAENKMAYAKVGLYGDAGSGKTVTASKLAIGLYKMAKLKKPVAFFDTEPAASFVIPLFEKAGIELLTVESRTLSDLMDFMDEAENDCSIAIVDSITHVWKDAQESYIAKQNKIYEDKGWKKRIDQIEFQDWRHIKGQWALFTDRFLSSKLHCFVCGRAGTTYSYQKNERSGKMELIQTGTKMATEKELGYEPSLLIEMSKQTGQNTGLVNTAFVEKDRNVSNPLTGKFFNYPEYKHFKNHFEFLNLGGAHFDSMETGDSSNLYEDTTGMDQFSFERQQREIQCEVIKDLFVQNGCDGSGKAEKAKRSEVMNAVFGTGSWTAVENMQSRDLEAKVQLLKQYFKKQAKKQETVDE